MFNTPILFTIFNRPAATKKVFDVIRAEKPSRLYIAADGPREGNEEDAIRCLLCREIVSALDWDCEVKTNYRSINLGCGKSMSSAITWFFENEEEGIIIEDDCLPNKSFFEYCESLLEKYRNDAEVMMICGTTYQTSQSTNESYYFSKYVHVWGWASWKRAWMGYKYQLENLQEVTEVLKKTFRASREYSVWLKNMKMIIDGFDTWDYQWMYHIWKLNGLSIIPWNNMVSNIGFGPDATHTFDISSEQALMKRFELETLRHPQRISVNKKADAFERDLLAGSLIDHGFKTARSFAGRQVRKIING